MRNAPILIVFLSTSLAAMAADVRSFGAVGNGITDDTVAIQNAINSCPSHGTVTFSAGNYLVSGLSAHGQCTYSGASGGTITLSASNHFIFDISEQTNLRITGLVLDGNGLGGAIIAQGYAPVTNVQIDHNEIRNVVASAWFPANLALVSTWGFVSSGITDNQFVNVSGGVWLTTVENVNILNNTFSNVTQSDAIYIAPNPVSFPSGDNLVISGNSGSNIANIGIEIFRPDPSNGSVLTAPVISNNSFSNFTAGSGMGMGLSITHGDGAQITGNRIANAGGIFQINGIEVIVSNAQIGSNVVSGNFFVGVAVQGTAAPTITQNTITGMGDTGIDLACDAGHGRCASHNAVISNNTIDNARLVGIKLDNDWTGSTISRNTMVRTGGYWPGDGDIWFSGVHQSPAPGPGVISWNTTVQDSPAPPPGFWFCGVRVNSQMPGSSILNNTAVSETAAPFGSGLIDNTGNATTGWIITGNNNVNTYHAVN